MSFGGGRRPALQDGSVVVDLLLLKTSVSLLLSCGRQVEIDCRRTRMKRSLLGTSFQLFTLVIWLQREKKNVQDRKLISEGSKENRKYEVEFAGGTIAGLRSVFKLQKLIFRAFFRTLNLTPPPFSLQS